jgi:hypothetical protein
VDSKNLQQNPNRPAFPQQDQFPYRKLSVYPVAAKEQHFYIAIYIPVRAKEKSA